VDPVVLFFLLGVAARLAKSDLRVPEAMYQGLTIFLLLAIGLKGGVELARQPFLSVLPLAVGVVVLGSLLPLIAFPIARLLGGLPRADAASLAAHYGSVSMVTFAVGLAYLVDHDVAHEEYMPLFVVLLEVPGIVIGILLAKMGAGVQWGLLAREVLLGRSVVLLAGGLLIGWISGPEALKPYTTLFFDLFKGLLALFMLEMGLVAAARLPDVVRRAGFLVLFGIGVPLLFAAIGTLAGIGLGLSAGGTMLLATLSASASYIAAPAAVRIAVPEANPSLSLAASLGVTFPFNVLLGVPLYLWLSRTLHGLIG
jgi:uncharacterized protein